MFPMKDTKLPYIIPKSNAMIIKNPENFFLSPSSLSAPKAKTAEFTWPFVIANIYDTI